MSRSHDGLGGLPYRSRLGLVLVVAYDLTARGHLSVLD